MRLRSQKSYFLLLKSQVARSGEEIQLLKQNNNMLSETFTSRKFHEIAKFLKLISKNYQSLGIILVKYFTGYPRGCLLIELCSNSILQIMQFSRNCLKLFIE